MSIQMIERPKHIASLRSQAILIRAHMTAYSGMKTDHEVSDEVNTSKKAEMDASKVIKNLLAGIPEHRAISLYRQKVTSHIKDMTLPWDDTLRALPVMRLGELDSKWNNEWFPTWTTMVDALCARWPSIISDAAFKQGDMFKREDFLSVDEVRRRHKMRLYKSEIPQGDFRELALQGAADDLHNHYQQQADQIVRDLVMSQSQQLIDVMESISKCCDYNIKQNDDGTTKITRRKLHSVTIEKALELCELYKQFNVTEDIGLEDARASLEAVLAQYGNDTKVISSSELARAHVKSEVDSILSKFKI
jgi:hypothetical protein